MYFPLSSTTLHISLIFIYLSLSLSLSLHPSLGISHGAAGVGRDLRSVTFYFPLSEARLSFFWCTGVIWGNTGLVNGGARIVRERVCMLCNILFFFFFYSLFRGLDFRDSNFFFILLIVKTNFFYTASLHLEICVCYVCV